MASTRGGVFGFDSGLIIQEFGYDDDVDAALREAVEAETGATVANISPIPTSRGRYLWP